MAVDSAAAAAGGMNEPPPQKMDASPSELASGAPSPSASPLNALDRNGSADSSPYSRKGAEIESPEILKSEEYRQLFRLPPEEVLIEDFNCAFQENILIQGHMYLFVNFICFYSNIFGFETKRIIPFHEVTSVRRAKTAGLFPNAIEIFAGGRKYFFASFLSRDEAFNIINEGWSQQRDGARAGTEQQESMSESSSQENGIIAIENLESSDIPDNELLATNLDNSSKDTASMAVPEQQSSVTEVAEPVSNNADTRMTWDWKEENSNAPKIPEVYTNVAESKFPIKVEDFFRYFFSDDAVNFLKSFHERCGDKDFKCTSWHPREESGYTRENSFQHPIKIYLGAKFGGCHEVQTLRIYKNSHLVLETSQEVSDVPYGDYFRVEGLWDVQRDENESEECCILRVYVNVAFSKKTIWKGKIVQSTIEECREAYAAWINLAHELLKQKNLEKYEESGPTSTVTQTGEVNLESKQKTGESSERSQEAINPARVPPITDIVNPSPNFGNRLQGNLIDSTSVSCMLRECMIKFRSSLKSQSHLSLFLVIIFAVIFFMQQFSILVLLSRPQHIHVSSPADFMNRNGMTRSPSDIAWLEKRVHFLKDEMYMVESRLERMRYEHSLLKKQLKDLELDHRQTDR